MAMLTRPTAESAQPEAFTAPIGCLRTVDQHCIPCGTGKGWFNHGPPGSLSLIFMHGTVSFSLRTWRQMRYNNPCISHYGRLHSICMYPRLSPKPTRRRLLWGKNALFDRQKEQLCSFRYIETSAIMTVGGHSWDSHLPFQGSLRNMERVPSLEELQQLLEDARAAVHAYQQQHPHVHNLTKLQTRIRKDLSFITQLQQATAAARELSAPERADLTEAGGVPGAVSEGRLQVRMGITLCSLVLLPL